MTKTTDPLDMSLDDLIKKNKHSQGQNSNITAPDRVRGGSGYGPTRRFLERGPTKTRPYSLPHGLEKQDMIVVGNGTRKEAGTKLYISNLHCGVSDDDIKVLFSEVGELKRYGIHFDESGRSKGTAEVVFTRESDALAAIKRYNNLRLDGRPLNIDFIGIEFVAPATSPTHGMWWQSGQEKVAVQGRKDEGGSRRFGQGQIRGRRHGKAIPAEDLDC